MSNIMLSSNNKKPLVKKLLLLFSQKDIHKGHVVLAIIRDLFIQTTCYTRVYVHTLLHFPPMRSIFHVWST